MKADYFMLAESAVAHSGRHFIHGGGLDLIRGKSFPLRVSTLAAALRLTVDNDEAERGIALSIDVRDGRDQALLAEPLSGRLQRWAISAQQPGRPQRICATFRLTDVDFPQPGEYQVLVSADSEELGRESLMLTSTPASPDSTGGAENPAAVESADPESVEQPVPAASGASPQARRSWRRAETA